MGIDRSSSFGGGSRGTNKGIPCFLVSSQEVRKRHCRGIHADCRCNRVGNRREGGDASLGVDIRDSINGSTSAIDDRLPDFKSLELVQQVLRLLLTELEKPLLLV